MFLLGALFGLINSVQQVFVVQGDRGIRRPVRFGLSSFDYFEVVDGLADQEVSSMPEVQALVNPPHSGPRMISVYPENELSHNVLDVGDPELRKRFTRRAKSDRLVQAGRVGI